MIALTVRQLQSAGLDKTFPMNIHGRVYQTQEEYDERSLHDFINGM